MLTLAVEGWLSYAQSHSIVNQFQCLELLKRADVQLFHKEAAQPPSGFLKVGSWKPSSGLLPPESEKALLAIPEPPESTDATYRIAFPFDFSRSKSRRTFTFAVVEGKQLHQYMVAGKKPLNEALDEDVTIITPSEFSRTRLIASGASPERVVVVPHGIDPATFHPVDALRRAELREKQGFRPDDVVFLNVGALYGRKGTLTLLKAFSAIAPKYKQARLMLKGIDAIYGSRKLLWDVFHSLPDDVREIVNKRSSYRGNEMSFAELADFYRSADVFVSPYELEGFNMPVLEAMACGLPVICTACGPTDEFTTETFAQRIQSRTVTRNDGSEHLAPDLDHLIHLMETAIIKGNQNRRKGMLGASFAAANYSWARVTDRLLDVIQS